MVLGMRNKNRRGPSTQVEYLVHVQEIKPWPPTQSLKTVRSVLIQWENGERNSGSTIVVTPSLDDGKIEFNESFRLPVTLSRDMSVKNGDTDVFHKNLLEFNLYEPRRDKTVKGQLLGTAIVDLADYGIVKEVTSVGVPLNCTRSFRNSAQPILHLRLQAYDRARSSSSLRGRLTKEGSLDKNDSDSVSALMNEEYADEAEIGSLTDDDSSSLSSVTASSIAESNGTSPLQNKENGSGRMKSQNVKDYSHNSNLSSPKNLPNLSKTSDSVSESTSVYTLNAGVESSTSCQLNGSGPKVVEEIAPKPRLDEGLTVLANKVVPTTAIEKLESEDDLEYQISEEKGKRIELPERVSRSTVAPVTDADVAEFIIEDDHGDDGYVGQILDEERHFVGGMSPISLLNAAQKQVLSETDDLLIGERPWHVKSVRSSVEPTKTNVKVKQEPNKAYKVEKRSASSDNKTQELEQRIKVLETELREVAAMEVALYSIAAEHGSSINKVHAPARRLCRLYLQASNGMKRSTAAQNTISGLVVVAKACGNDVPRLTFWLSNCVVLRAIVSEAFEDEQLPVSGGPFPDKNGTSKRVNKASLKWKVSSFEKLTNSSINGNSQDWGNPNKFMSTLEKLESWIFSRIVESVWWQTLTPHMQSSATKMVDREMDSNCKKNFRRTSSSAHQEQVNLSLELWKRAFKDACERLCPVRSAGHECGCLPVLAKLIMEQCVARLDVAMLNALLRESSEDIPTDPVSDPISDAQVLPIPAGKSSFGAGAQLKNAIGNWSRLLADLFGIDDDDAPEDGMIDDDVHYKHGPSFKSFHLLKSLSDLMMLPKDMLLSESVRHEVCPKFGAALIKRVLENFVPDEFCPDPIPDDVFDALYAEVIDSDREDAMAQFPCRAPSVDYSPPLASSLVSIMGGSFGTGGESQLRRSASVCRRSNTSDDELDELESPLNFILCHKEMGSFAALSPHLKSIKKVPRNHQNNVVRYQLLRQVWNDGVES
ncbi:uncharacterized protein LOC141622466 [Silene latifolia]|uniref:uncharacterized protein LOC141622466 n=1 Tax=Silene latifolia TaxID=37657 RepID=UPI003D77E01C